MKQYKRGDPRPTWEEVMKDYESLKYTGHIFKTLDYQTRSLFYYRVIRAWSLVQKEEE